MSKLRIAFVNDWFGLQTSGGVEKTIDQIANYIGSDKYEVRIFTPYEPQKIGEREINGLKIIYVFGLNLRRSYMVSNFLKLIEQLRILVDPISTIILLYRIKSFEPNIIFFHNISRYNPLILFFTKKFFKTTEVVRVYHDVSDTCLLRSRYRNNKNCFEICSRCKFKNRINAKMSVFPDKSIFNSKFVESDLKINGFEISNSSVGYPIIIRELNENRIDCHTRVPNKSVGFVGRITKLKGVETILEAASKTTPKWSVHFVGLVSDDYKNYLIEYSKFLGIECNFYGILENPYEFLFEIVDCLVVASQNFEAFGKVPLEAALMGIPTISTNIGGLVESLGFIEPSPRLFKPGDASSLADVLQNFEKPRFLKIKYNNEYSLAKKVMDILINYEKK